MPDASIRYRGRFAPSDGRDASDAHVYDVVAPDGAEFSVAILMSGQTRSILRRDVPPETPAADISMDVLRRIGVMEIEQRFAAGVYPPDDTSRAAEILYSSDLAERFFSIARSEKECLWQERAPGGYVCHATPLGEDSRTTPPICAQCEIPDSREICSHLVHPQVQPFDSMGGPFIRTSVRVFCNVGNDPGDGAQCRSGGLECWERRLAMGEQFPVPPADVAKRVADELDFFGLVFRDRYGARPLQLSQARSVAELFEARRSEADFQRGVAVLADILAQLQVGAAFESPPADADGDPLRPLAALRVLLERDYPEAEPQVRTLRAIPRVRNLFPQHSRTEGALQGMRDLGVDYPATDWNLAWLQVLTAFLVSLEGIRVALQAGPPVGGES